MNSIAKFFTIYWIIYFPTCIAFYDYPRFTYVDEVMTVILIGYTFLRKGHMDTNSEPWHEYYGFLSILAFYIVYSLLFGANVSDSVWYDLIQQIRPFSIIYCTWILNPQFSEKQKKWMLWSMIISLGAFIFTNPIIGTVRNAPVGQLAICTAMTFYLYTEKTKKNLYWTIVIATVGLISMKFKYYGEWGVFVAMLLFMREKMDLGSGKAKVQIAFLIVIAIILGWERFDHYFVSGFYDEEIARPRMYRTAFTILWEYFPFGSGMGTFGTAASAVYYSPLYPKYGLNHVWGLNTAGGFICDSFYPSMAQFGIVGIILFIVFWRRRLRRINELEDIGYYMVGLMACFCLAIEQTADSSWLSGKGMGFCMLIGLCMNANRNLISYENENENEEGNERSATIGDAFIAKRRKNQNLNENENENDYKLHELNELNELEEVSGDNEILETNYNL